MSNQSEFDDAAEWLQDEVDYDTQELAMLVMEECVTRSPVDTGRFRGNWIASINKETDRERDVLGNTSPIPLARAVIKRAMKSGKNVDEIWIQNNLPYAGVIDDGLYPNPPKKGSYLGKGKGYAILSSGGFSKQAPQGISDQAIKAALERSK